MREKDDKMKTKEETDVEKRKRERWGRKRAQREQREVREREKRKDKQRCFRVSGRHGRKKGEEREKSTGVHKERETD